MLGFYEKLTFVAAVVLTVSAAVSSSPVVGPEPIRCAPCTPQKLNDCPAIPADCKQVLREPGCGCCMACALEKGASCGVHTAQCGEGLHCTPRPGEARPLHALTRGQGVCTEELGQGSLRFSISTKSYNDTSFPLKSLKYVIQCLQRNLTDSLTTAPYTTYWALIFPLKTTTLLRVKKVSRPGSTLSATN